jgi:hypothetical protein
MKKPKRRDALRAACLQAAATVWATGKLHPHYGANTPQQHADGLADFALLLYQAWTRRNETAPKQPDNIRTVFDDPRTLPADKAPTAPSAGTAKT